MKRKKTANKNSEYHNEENRVEDNHGDNKRRIMVIIMRTVEMMTMRVMVLIMRMADTFAEHCMEAVQSCRKQTPNGKGTKSRGR